MRHPVPESSAVNHTQPRPRAHAWRVAITENNPLDWGWVMACETNNPDGQPIGNNLCWTDEMPF